MTFKDIHGLAVRKGPEADPGVSRRGSQSNCVALKRRSAFATWVPCYAVAPVFANSDGQHGVAGWRLPQLDATRPRGCAEELCIWRELSLRQRPLISHLGNFCDHRLLEEHGESVNALLVLDRILIHALATLLNEPLVGSGERPLRDFHTCLQQLLHTFRVEQVLVSSGLLPLGVQGGCRSARHDGPQTISSLIGALTENANRLAELPELGFDLRVPCGHRHLALGPLLLEGSHRLLMLLPCPCHVIGGTSNDVRIAGHMDVGSAEGFTVFPGGSEGPGEVSIMQMLRHAGSVGGEFGHQTTPLP
mmetsp:Transcript_46151/g.82792  ORF Transcript_46151/g.82792 Transcript_46151/m.82792 type:complete len:305 (+) Transcript_46151:823-1737(+)